MEHPQNIFMIIDGSAIIHRAYHAMPNFSNSKGVPTGAVHGFFAMILKLIQNVHPKDIAIAFDLPAPTFRQELYVGYQAQRPEVSDSLGPQFDIVRTISKNAGIPIYEVAGFEADDVIGTIARRVAKERPKDEVYVVTGDRDMLQLVTPQVKVLMPIKGISEMALFDEKRVEEKYGLPPKKFIDYKALTGDASDNYPGVDGVGPKTAMTLLAEYDTFENIYGSISVIEKKNPRLALKLADSAEQAALAKRLATIVTDVPFEFHIKDCDITHVTKERFQKAFAPVELKTLTKRLDEVFGEEKLDEKRAKTNQMKLI